MEVSTIRIEPGRRPAESGARAETASRCVVVLGTGRSGPSAVAGILHTLGVSVGRNLLGSNRSNPRGYFEDRDLVNEEGR